MKVLFSHQNFPAQFGDFAFYLARSGWDVTFATAAEGAQPVQGVRILRMKPHRDPAEGVHRFALPLEKAAINGQAFANSAIQYKNQGYTPDVVVAHAAWGSGTYAKAVWPETRYVTYAEWYYNYPYVDALDDTPPASVEDARAHALSRNAPMLLDLVSADYAQCPSHFQADQFPAHLRERIEVFPDGVDVIRHAPAETPVLPEAAGDPLPETAEIVTYATRGMEPHRGFPEFCRALAALQKTRPNLYAVIGGEDRVAYGRQLPEGDSWKKRMLAELDLDESRIRWTGLLPRSDYVKLLQASHIHVYLTVPFVLSWSLLESMSIGCSLVATDVAPVREAMTDGVEGSLVPRQDVDAIVNAVNALLDDRDRARAMGAAARARILREHDARWVFAARARKLADLVRTGRVTGA